MTAQPPVADDERAQLIGFLDLYRDVMMWKLEGLSEEQARFRPAPSANSLLNLIVHLTGVEKNWFQNVIAGRAVERYRAGEFEELDISVPDAVAAYREECRRSNETLVTVRSMDDRCRGADQYTVRWVLHHVLEETARHAGHADITRELIDGHVGWSRSDPG